MLHHTETRLQELGISLPEPSIPVAGYSPWKLDSGLLYISGQLPFRSKEKGIIVGRLDKDNDDQIQAGQEAAQLCALHLLAQAKNAVDFLDRVISVIKLTGYVNCTENFTQIPKVINGASDLLIKVLGEKGRHVRSAVGCSSLPLGAMVEVEATFLVS